MNDHRDVSSVHDGFIETLAAGIAHEVRNPLNSVQINLGILERELSELLPDRSAHAFSVVRKIAGEIKRLDDFVAEFLRFARPPRLNRELVRVRTLLGDLVAFITPECAKQGVGLQMDLRGPETVRLDGFQLKQAVLNLVLNALQATAPGGRILIRTAGDAALFQVSVEDDGEGMSPEVRAQALTPFFTTREDGTGLGLPLVRRIVEEHGGTVELESEAQRGTVVTLLFPAGGTP